jgi:hypothetical protein
MTWLGKMVSNCNYMEQLFRAFVVCLLQSRKPETAIIVSRERRSFPGLVDLIEELFMVYDHEESLRTELEAVGDLAKKLYEERNTHVHSLWCGRVTQCVTPE